MLLLIAFANVPVFVSVNIFAGTHVDTDPLSRTMEALAALLADGRAYPLFSILFGFGLAMLTRSKVRAGWTPGQVRRYLAVRMLWLLAIGAVHGLFFPGDIIGAYALTGLILVLLVFAETWVVWLVTGISGGLWLLVNTGTMVGMGLTGTTSVTGGDEFMADFGYNLLVNLAGWAVGSIGTVLAASLPLVLVGFLIGRSGWLTLTSRTVHRMQLVAAGSLLLGLLTGLLAAAGLLGWAGGEGWWVGLARLTGPVMALGYLALAALIGYHWSGRGGPGTVGGWLIETGRRSLTCYLLQTVLFILLLSPYGPLALSDRLSSGQARLFGVGVWVVTVLVAVLLARAGRPGPADALLRALSNRRRPQPVGDPAPRTQTVHTTAAPDTST